MPGSGKIYDEEQVRWRISGHQALKKMCFRFPNPRRARSYLLLADIFIVLLLVHALEPLITLLRRNHELFAVDSQVPTPGREPETRLAHIPRILHQTCANETVPSQWVDSQQSCKEAYADFEYMLWTDDSARDFISSHYPWFLRAWDNYAFPIQRADSIRYFMLYHYGGIYLDMDTWCKEPFPVHQLETDKAAHAALFKATLPTGVTNDIMISSARHPVFAAAVSNLPRFYDWTWVWARLLPYCNIMLSSGPLFLSLMMKDYLLQQPSLPSPDITVVGLTQLEPFITDLESSTWHRADAKVLMWLGCRPWAWFSLGIIGLVPGLWLCNRVLLYVGGAARRCVGRIVDAKQAKMA